MILYRTKRSTYHLLNFNSFLRKGVCVKKYEGFDVILTYSERDVLRDVRVVQIRIAKYGTNKTKWCLNTSTDIDKRKVLHECSYKP